MSRHPDDAFDRRARDVHAASLDALSPRVQAQLAQRHRAATGRAPMRRAPWGWATAAASACVLVIALQVRPPVDPTPASAPMAPVAVAPVTEAAPDPGGMLAEEPEFYAWLASNESPDFVQE